MHPIQKCMIAVIIVALVMVITGIWTNDWRWIATGFVIGAPALIVTLGIGLS